MQPAESASLASRKPIPIGFILLTAFALHAPLLLMMLPLKSYDANFHILFASNYVQHWFDPWNPKWYAGFSQTTYPPLPQQWLALVSYVTGLDFAYMIVQMVAILLLTIGMYRFARIWVGPRAASLAALAAAFSGSEAFLVYSAGQLSTTFAAPLYLNSLPYLYDWVRRSSWRSLLKGSVLSLAAASAHHATLLFGSVLFAAPVLVRAFMHDPDDEVEDVPFAGFLTRTVTVTAIIAIGVLIVILPFWIALLKYPVTQVPIPHPSRANFILSPNWGLNYFIVPYGAMILALPFIVIRGASVRRLRPLLIGFWIAFLLGLGGTTPVGRVLLGRAFYVITMERFAYWATLLGLPFVGLLAEELIDRFRGKAMATLAIAGAVTYAGAVAYLTFHPPDAQDFKVDSIAAWLNRDGHDKYRYVTLGFGNKIARLAVLTDASSVDGEWNSGRQLPELQEHGAGALTSSKFFGVNGIAALDAILQHADRYGLKWVLCRDSYYEPLLVFSGWRKVDTLEDKTISVWSKENAPPAAPINAPQIPPSWQGLLWGILPIGSSILALLLVFVPDRRRVKEPHSPRPTPAKDELVLGRLIS